jgi:hypothetical protein
MDPARMEMEYSIPKPVLDECAVSGSDTVAASSRRPGKRIMLANAPRMGSAGQPLLPVIPVKLILANGYEVESVEVVKGESVPLDGEHFIEPKERPVPLVEGATPEPVPADPVVYESDDPWPGKQTDVVTVQKRRGVSVLVLNLYPIEYRGKSGKVSYYPSLELKVKARPAAATTSDRDAVRYRRDPARPVTEGVENPEMLEIGGYVETPAPASGATGGVAPLGLCNPADSFQYVIVTSEAISNATTDVTVRDLAAHKRAKGISSAIVTIESILASYSGRDDPEKLRNFIKDAYNNWETDFVLLGGDVNVIPLRKLWCEAWPGAKYVENIPSDLYYQCLDGDYNRDNDDRWGEPTDGDNGGDVDLVAEVYIGRASAENAAEMANFVYKTLYYENSDPGADYLRRNLMVGEYLGFGGVMEYATATMEEVKNGTTNHGYTTAGFASSTLFTSDTLYDSPSDTWAKSDIINKINSGVYGNIDHLGHAGPAYVMKFYNADADAMTNPNPFFSY